MVRWPLSRLYDLIFSITYGWRYMRTYQVSLLRWLWTMVLLRREY
jgi:hypothetical protein